MKYRGGLCRAVCGDCGVTFSAPKTGVNRMVGTARSSRPSTLNTARRGRGLGRPAPNRPVCLLGLPRNLLTVVNIMSSSKDGNGNANGSLCFDRRFRDVSAFPMAPAADFETQNRKKRTL